MNTIAQCKFCNKPFYSIGGKVCPDCLDQIDEDFTTIRDYMYDNPGCFDIDSICKATGVHKKVALHLIEEERLVIAAPDGGPFSCSVCRKPIPSGSICEDCTRSLSSTLGSSIAATPAPVQKEKKISPHSSNSAGMHIRRDSGKGRGRSE